MTIAPDDKARPIPSGWELVRDGTAIERSFEFGTFLNAVAFMNRLVPICEGMGHHPEWMNVYSRVDVVLTTHDRGTVTELDLRLASEMNRLAADRAA